MATTIYARSATGSDSNNGLSVETAVATISKARELADAAHLANPIEPVTVNASGYFSIPSGGTASSVLYNSAVSQNGFTLFLGTDTWIIYGTHFQISGDGYQTKTLQLPSGCSIEFVTVDHEMQDASHVTSDGRRKILLASAVDASACQITADSFFHDSGSNTLHVNISSTVSGTIVVRYRPSAALAIVDLTGTNLTVQGFSRERSGILAPAYVSPTIGCYAIKFNAAPGASTGYVVEGLSIRGAWHHVGVIDSSTSGTLAFNDIYTRRCEFVDEVVSDLAGQSANPCVIYSGNNTGTMITPIYIDIEDWHNEHNLYYSYRPVYFDGTTLAAGTGGTTGNNISQLFYAHGANAYALVRVTNPKNDSVHCHNCKAYAWDYKVVDPYFAQPSYQAITYAKYDDSVWGVYALDCEYRSMLTYVPGHAGTDYGLFVFSSDRNIRFKRCQFKLPDAAALSGGLGGTYIRIASTTGDNVFFELDVCTVMFRGMSVASYKRWIQLANVGAPGTPAFQCNGQNVTVVQEASTMSESIVLFDCLGTMTAKIDFQNTIFHSNDTVNTDYWVMIYDANTTQLPLRSTDATALVMKNNHYSNIGSSRFDVTGGGQRDTAAEWRTGSDGPQDGILADGLGTDALYTSAGTWSPADERFGSSDAARTSKISTLVTLGTSPLLGINGRPFARSRGSQQWPRGASNSVAMRLLGAQ